MKPTDSIRTIKGIGEKSEKLFYKLGISTVGELLNFFPREYDIFTPIQPIQSVKEGEVVIIEGSFVTKPHMANVRNLKILSCQIKDTTAQIRVSWFNMPFLMRSLKMGMHYIIQGIFVLVGLLAILASLLNWEWFFTAHNTQFIVHNVGRQRARLFYALLGLMMIATGVYFFLNVQGIV